MRTVLCVLLVLGCGCGRKRNVERDERIDPDSSVTRRVGEIRAQLLGDDPAERADAIAQVRSLVRRGVLASAEGVELLRLVDKLDAVTSDAGVFESDVQFDLLDALADDPRLEYVEPIETLGRYLRPAARMRAFEMLALLDDPDAARVWIELLERYPDPAPHQAFVNLRAYQPQPDVFLPRLIELARHPQLFFEVLYTTLNYCETADLTPAPVLEAHGAWLLASYRQRRDLALPMQQPGLDWIFEDDYSVVRSETALLLDLLGFVAGDDALGELRAALAYRDPRLVYFAIEALAQRDELADRATIERVAASVEMRGALHNLLVGLDELDEFPARWRTQALLAESTMVSWLVTFDEIGRLPAEMELLEVVTIEAEVEIGDAGAVENRTFDYYVYRFRVEPAVVGIPEGWLAGVAGPFARDLQPTANDGGGTRSLYQPAASLTPQGHLDALRDPQGQLP